MGIDIAAMSDAEKLAFAQATGQILLDSKIVSSPLDNFVFALPASYYDFLLVGHDITLNADASGLLTFALGDEGISGEFYKDDVTFLGYQIEQEIITDPSYAAQGLEDGYGYILSLQGGVAAIGRLDRVVIFPGSATSYATIDADGSSFWTNPPSVSKGISRYRNTLVAEQVRMNALRVCTAFAGGQINTGSFALFGRAFA